MNDIKSSNLIKHPKLISYPVTPFMENGDLDEGAYVELLEHLLIQGADAICILGSVAEVAYLSTHEKKRLIAIALNELRGKCPVYVGVLAKDTMSTIQLAMYAKDCGADGIMLSPYSYFALSEVEIYEFFQQVAEAVNIPIIFYNNSVSSGNPLTAKFIIEMVRRIHQIKFIKDSSGDISQIKRLLEIRGNHQVKIFNGSNKIAIEALELGVDGWCTVTPCFLDEIPKNLLLGQPYQSRSPSSIPENHLNKLLSFICEKGLVQTSKAALNLLGRTAGEPRLPLQPLGEKLIDPLKQLLKKSATQESIN